MPAVVMREKKAARNMKAAEAGEDVAREWARGGGDEGGWEVGSIKNGLTNPGGGEGERGGER